MSPKLKEIYFLTIDALRIFWIISILYLKLKLITKNHTKSKIKHFVIQGLLSLKNS